MKAEGEAALATSHTTAQFTRAKKLEPLSRYLPRHGARPSGGGSLLDRMKSIALANGGTVIG